MENNTNTLATVTEFKDIIAKEYGYDDFDDLLNFATNGQLSSIFEDTISRYAILFAKHHRTKQIEAIYQNATVDYFEGLEYVNRNSIENAYSEDNIK